MYTALLVLALGHPLQAPPVIDDDTPPVVTVSRMPAPIEESETPKPLKRDEPFKAGDLTATLNRAKSTGQFAIIFVGMPARDVPGLMVTQAPELDGFITRCVVVSVFHQGKFIGASLKDTATDADIRKEIASRRIKMGGGTANQPSTFPRQQAPITRPRPLLLAQQPRPTFRPAASGGCST